MTWLTNPFRFAPPAPGSIPLPPVSLRAARYWHFQSHRWSTNANWRLAELEMAATAGGADQCTGGTPISSFGTGAANAFDNNNATFYENAFTLRTDDPWVGYDFGSPVTVAEVRARSHSNNVPLFPILRYSDDGTNWFTYATLDAPGWAPSTTLTWTFSTSLSLQSNEWRVYTERQVNLERLIAHYYEVQFANTVGGPNLAIGGTASGFDTTHNSNDLGSSSLPERCFDGNAATYSGITNFNRLSVGYIFPAPVYVGELRVTGQPTATVDALRDIQLQRRDGSNVWRTVAQIRDIASWANGETKSVVVP